MHILIKEITFKSSAQKLELKWSVSGYRLQNVPSLITYTKCVTRLTRKVPLVEQELLTIPDHLSSLPVFSGVRVTRYLVLCVCFVDRCLSFYFWPLSVLSVLLRLTDSDYLPLVSSNSSSILQLGDNCIVYEDLSGINCWFEVCQFMYWGR
jgi:hypothetical protein